MAHDEAWLPEAIAGETQRRAPDYLSNLAGFTFAMVGYLITSFILVWGFSTGAFSIPGGDAFIWDRVGDEVRAGISPYYQIQGSGGFYFAPPWAMAFALVSWVPPAVLGVALMGLEVCALWYIAGSFTRLGWCLVLPMVAWELPSSQVNLLIAAAIAAALRGDPRAAVVMAAAKLSPILSIDLRQWRRALPIGLVLLAVTLPWPSLWLDWIAQLLRNTNAVNAPTQILIPIWPRLALALLLLLVRRPWARGLAAVVAIPLPYWVSSVLFLGLVPPLRRNRGGGASGA